MKEMIKTVLKISEVKNNPNNPRLIKDDKFKKLVQSLKDFPIMAKKLRRVVVDEDGVILGGNMRFKAIKEAGMKEVYVEYFTREDAEENNRLAKELDPLYVDKTYEEQCREFVIKDNVSGGEWDWDMMANEWDAEELAAWGLDLPADWAEETEVEEDEAPEVSDEPPVSKLGEVYQLGRHRIMCADSTVKENVELLMNGEKADMVFTDPPYGIKIVSRSGNVGGGGDPSDGGYAFGGAKNTGTVGGNNKAKAYAKIIGDDTTEAAQEFYRITMNLGFKNQIIFGGNYFTDFLPPSACWVVWDKENTGNFADVEMAWTSFDKGAKLYKWLWNGLSRKGDRESELVSRVHPTQKPVGLIAEILRDFTEDEAVVLDGFLGSGSTLIASEQIGRTCYGTELSPAYVDVIRKRYHKFVTGSEEGWEEATKAVSV